MAIRMLSMDHSMWKYNTYSRRSSNISNPEYLEFVLLLVVLRVFMHL